MTMSGMPLSLMLSKPAAHLDNSQVHSLFNSCSTDASNSAVEPADHLAATTRFIAISRVVVWMLKISLLEAC